MILFKEIAALLSLGERLVLATILDRSGSAPRAVGSRMVIRSNGSILGTIGGGILEARVQGLASEVFNSRRTLVRTFTLTAEEACLTGMICGGQVRVLLHGVDASDASQIQLHQTAAALLSAHREAWLVTRIPPSDDTFTPPDQGLLGSDGLFAGTLDLALTREVVARFSGRQPDLVRHGSDGFLVEPLSREGCVFIFGAGHISRDLAPLTHLVGFRTVVLDDRPEFASRDRFPSADEIRVVPSFERSMDGLELNGDSYLVIVTRGHAHDRTVLGLALKTDAGYIGMIGSKRKRDAIYEALLMEGFTHDDLKRVHSPIGLKIGAETPVEIAVSIVAELIRTRAG